MGKFCQVREACNILLYLKGKKYHLNRFVNGGKLFCTTSDVPTTKGRRKRKNDIFIVPSLSPERISEISSVTGLSIGMCYFSWVRLAILPSLTILEWNAKLLPDEFRSKTNEHEILKLAYNLKRGVPNSDIYIMETFSMRGKELHERVNEIHLSSMLTVLLNGADLVPGWMDKVFFQKRVVLNRLYDLLIGSERVSSRMITEGLININKERLLTISENDEKYLNLDTSSLQVQPKCLDIYNEAGIVKKEDLSLALLLTLSFLEVNVFKNTDSIMKLTEKRKYQAY